ncbi:MAG: TIR domain-containing protein [Bdellovibrio sp.]|nr:TIR domain-containing protein [Bdellovibrio sp.]
MTKGRHQIFISYSSKDIKECEAIRDEIEKHDLQCWMAPRDILPGDVYASSIIDAIGQASIFLLFVTEHSNSSLQVQKEVDRAVNARLKIIGFILKQVELSKALNYYLCDSHWIDGSCDRKKAVKLLIESIKAQISAVGDLPPPLPKAPTDELIGHTQWQKKILMPLFLCALIFCAMGAFLLLKPDAIKSIAALLPRKAFQLEVRPLPTNGLGDWSERFGKRVRYHFEPAARWLPPAFAHLFTREELAQKSIQELDLLYEEIRARHGYLYEDPLYRQHFESQSWYRPLQGQLSVQEINQMIEDQMPIVDEDNRALVARLMHEKNHEELLRTSQYFKQTHVKVFPLIYFNLAAARLTQAQRDLEQLSFVQCEEMAIQLMFDKKIPAEWGPKELSQISMNNPWEWYKTQTAPFLIYLSFVEESGDGIKIYHADNQQSKDAAVFIQQHLMENIAQEQNIYPWKIVLAGDHPILNHNSQGVSLLIHVVPFEGMNDFSQLEVAGKLLQATVVEMVFKDFQQRLANKTDKIPSQRDASLLRD